MAPVIDVTEEQLLARREAILASIHMSAAEFDEARATRSLTGPEWDAREELDAIAFLLGESAS